MAYEVARSCVQPKKPDLKSSRQKPYIEIQSRDHANFCRTDGLESFCQNILSASKND